MNLVNKVAKKSGLTSSKLKGSQAAATRLTAYFGITKTQVYLLSVAFFEQSLAYPGTNCCAV